MNKQDYDDGDEEAQDSAFDVRKRNALARLSLSTLGALRAHGADCAILMLSSQDEQGNDRMFRFQFGSALMRDGLLDNYARIADAERSSFADHYVDSGIHSPKWEDTFDDPNFSLTGSQPESKSSSRIRYDESQAPEVSHGAVSPDDDCNDDEESPRKVRFSLIRKYRTWILIMLAACIINIAAAVASTVRYLVTPANQGSSHVQE